MLGTTILKLALSTAVVCAPVSMLAQTSRPISSAVSPEKPITATNTSTPPPANGMSAADAANAPAPQPATHDSSTPALQTRYPRYKIQRDDVLSISFPLSPEFDQPKVMVQPDGYIDLQGIGSIHIQDLTLPETVEAIKKAYSVILHEPIIDVDLVDFQRPFFLVQGQVNKPGEYDLRHDTTVSEAIATAGGFAPTAKTQVFLYHRVSSDWVEVKQLSVKDILSGKKLNEDAQLGPGDMIFVPEKFITKFRKYVPYGIGTSIATTPYSY
jgi:polysaccharide biosynthesis/export protein